LIGGKIKFEVAFGGITLAATVIFACFALIMGFLGVGVDEASGKETGLSNWTGSTATVDKIGKAKLPDTSGKLGHEDHLFPGSRGGIGDVVSGDAASDSCIKDKVHYVGEDSKKSGKIITAGGCGAMDTGRNMTTDQERWYFNMRWDTSGNYPNDVRHKKVIITNPKNGKKIVASIEEYGPGARVTRRDGINCGAPTEVYKYLETASPYTGNPGDKKGYVEFGFAEDQNIPLGPLK
jgi:hypothetical protein